MNVELIFAMKQFGFGLSVLDQSSRERSERTEQGITQIGSGTWMKSLSKLTVRDFTFGVQSIMKAKCWSALLRNGVTKLQRRNSS